MKIGPKQQEKEDKESSECILDKIAPDSNQIFAYLDKVNTKLTENKATINEKIDIKNHKRKCHTKNMG